MTDVIVNTRLERHSFGSLIAASLALFLRSLGNARFVWIVLIAVTTATDYVDLVYGHSGPQGLVIGSLAARTIGVTWITAAALRRLTDTPRAWALDGAFWKYFAVQVVILVATFAAVIAAQKGLQFALTAASFAPGKALQIVRIASLPILLAGLLITVRLLPWIVALAVRDNALGFRAGWRGLSGRMFAFIGAIIVLVGPLFALHIMVTDWTLKAEPDMKLPLTLVDGPLSSIELMLMLALVTVVYREVAAGKRQ